MSDEDDRSLTPEEERLNNYWLVLAIMLGYNELAKLGKTLDEKVFFRMYRDDFKEKFIEYGGNDNVFDHDENVIKIVTPYASMPHLQFRAQDVELMRDYVYLYDKKQRNQ